MSKFVGQEASERASAAGRLIGRTEPTRETKGSWWEVYVMPDGSIIACVMDGTVGVVCGEQIERSEVGRYVDNEEAALFALAN